MRPIQFDGDEFKFDFDIGLENIAVQDDNVRQVIHLVGDKHHNDAYEEELLQQLRAQ